MKIVWMIWAGRIQTATVAVITIPTPTYVRRLRTTPTPTASTLRPRAASAAVVNSVGFRSTRPGAWLKWSWRVFACSCLSAADWVQVCGGATTLTPPKYALQVGTSYVIAMMGVQANGDAVPMAPIVLDHANVRRAG